MYDAYLIVKQLLLLPSGPLLLALAGLALMPRWPRAGRAAAWTGIGLLAVLSMPALSVLAGPQVEAEPLPPDAPPSCAAVVVLGGGVDAHAPEYGGPSLDENTLVRLRYGAWLARRHGLPIMVSGGQVTAPPAEAPVMARALEEEFGVEARWVEDRSRNTLENARHAAELLREAGIERPCVVTDGRHIDRAMQAFALAGMPGAVAAPTAAPEERDLGWTDFIPSTGGLEASKRLLYEWLGERWQWLRTELDL